MWFKRALLFLGSALAGLVLAEVTLRAMGCAPVVSQAVYLANDWCVPDEHLILIDRRFLEEATYLVEDGATVIAALGDSFTAGYPVHRRDSYPSRLEANLREVGWNVDVLNLGQGNTGTDQHLRLFEEYVLPRVVPDIVVWAFYANDVPDNIRQPVFDINAGELIPRDAHTHWMNRRQRLYEATPFRHFLRVHSRLYQVVLKSFEAGELPLSPNHVVWSQEKIRAATVRLERLSQEYGFEVHYALIAPESAYLARRDPASWAAHYSLQDHLRLRGALSETTDLTLLWFPESRAGLFANARRDGNREGDRHFNELGYSLMAKRIAERLLEARESES